MKRLLPILLLLAACANNSTPPDTADFDISLDKSALTVAAGASGALTVTVVPTGGFDRDVDLSYVRVTAPNAVSGGFSLSPTKTTSQFTLNVDASVSAGSYTLLVRGSSTVQGQPAKREKEVTLTVPAATTITVSGKVKNAFGVPLEAATVKLGSATTTTDASGGFTFNNIQAPYTLTVIPSGSSIENIFMGISRADPNLLLFQFSGGTPLQGSSLIGGSLSGAGVTFPNAANTATQVAFAAPTAQLTQITAPLLNLMQLNPGEGPAYSDLSVGWTGSTSVSGTLHALQWKYNSADPGRPDSFLAYGSLNLTVNNGINQTGKNITLQPITSGSLTANLTVPAGLTLASRQLYVNLSPKTLFWIGASTAASPNNITWVTPVITGKTLTYAAIASNADGRKSSMQLNGLQSSVVINPALDAPPGLTSPTAGQSGVVLNSSLVWSKPSNRISVVALTSTGVSRLYYTTDSNLSPALSSGKTYNWLVSEVGPFATMDDFTGPTWAEGYPTFGWDKTFYLANSVAQTFSTP